MGRVRLPFVAVLLFVVTLLVACSSSSKTVAPATTAAPVPTSGAAATTTSAVPLTASFRGVTATTIKLGIIMDDYECIKQYVDFNRGDQAAQDQVMINDLNAHGGVLGRTIQPVFMKYCSIGNAQALTACTSFTDDSKVFAVLGLLYDTTGDAQLCVSRDHQTILITHLLNQSFIDKAPPALLLTPDTTTERGSVLLLNLVKAQGSLTGKKIATLADQDSQGPVTKVVKPALDAMGLAQGDPAMLTITGTDTSAAQSQLDSFIEKWKGEGVNALFMAGNNVTSKQFVEKIKSRMPDVLLMTDSLAPAAQAGQDETAAGKKPNPYEGMLSSTGLNDSEVFKSAGMQKCVATYQAGSGKTVIGPDDLKPGPDGKRVEVWAALRDFCSELSMFVQIAEKAGPNLTNDSWTQAANTFGSMQLVPTVFASVHTGKYDADDGLRLVSFDSTVGAKGDFKGVTPIQDASK